MPDGGSISDSSSVCEPIKDYGGLPATSFGIGAGRTMMQFGRGDDKNRETDGGGILDEALRASEKRA